MQALSPYKWWLALLSGMLVLALALLALGPGASAPPIRVGILHSDSGTMAISEQSVRDSTLLAIEELNDNGGLLGRRIEAVVADGASNLATFASEARRLIEDEQVSVVFGCWTSASRKTVIPIFEKHKHLLFYPVQYEGLEQSPNVVYTGAAPNQQLVPAVKWCFDELSARRFFLVGSDYVFPKTANEIMKAQIAALHGQVVGEQYILLGSDEVDEVVEQIREADPDVILSTINGDSNIAFFERLRMVGITPEKIPTMSFSIAEDELRLLSPESMAGDYATWNYFQSLRSEQNQVFVHQFRSKYGFDRVTDDPIEAAYFGVHLWAQAVEDAGTAEPSAVRKRLAGQSYPAPGGIVSIDPDNQHTWKTVRVGKIRADGQFEIVWSSDQPVPPMPFPEWKTRAEWATFLAGLYDEWGGNWANPGSASDTGSGR